jgi:hypothetical protein
MKFDKVYKLAIFPLPDGLRDGVAPSDMRFWVRGSHGPLDFK